MVVDQNNYYIDINIIAHEFENHLTTYYKAYN